MANQLQDLPELSQWEVFSPSRIVTLKVMSNIVIILGWGMCQTALDVDVGGDGLVVGVDDGAVLDEDAVGGGLQVDRNLLQRGSRSRRHLGNCLGTVLELS